MNEWQLSRGKREDNGAWVIGYLTKQRRSPKDPNHTPPYHLQPVIDHEEKGVMLTSFVDPVTIGQCTGLRDKDGVLIFYGDVLSDIAGDTFRVFYNTAHCAYMAEYINCIPEKRRGFWRLGDQCSLGISIIGNIYDNPELLKRSADQ